MCVYNNVVHDIIYNIHIGTESEEDRKHYKQHVKLIRIINHRLYFDWPWKPSPGHTPDYYYAMLRLVGMGIVYLCVYVNVF